MKSSTSKLIASCVGTAIFLSLSACAGTTFRQVDDNNASFSGIVYYEPAPFILVYSDGKGGLLSKLLYLPDTTRKFVVNPYAVLASNNTTLTFDNGVLTGAKVVADETIIPTAIIDTAKSLAMAAVNAAALDAGETPGAGKTLVPAPALFRVFIAPDGSVKLRGDYGKDPSGKSNQHINITVSQPPKKSE